MHKDHLHPVLRQLPTDWRIARIDDLFTIQQGKQVSGKTRDGNRQRPFLRTKNVYWGRLDFTELDAMHFSEEDEQRLRLLPGDLLTCEGGWVGRSAIWNSEAADCLYQNHLHRLRRISADTDPQFALYWLWYAFEIGEVYFGRQNVTTIPNLSKSRLGELPMPSPSPDEQRQIATVLSAVQRAIERQERLIALTAELKKALMHKLFTEGTRGEPLKQTEIGPVPEGWEIVPIGSVAKIGNGSTPKRDNLVYWTDGTIPWLTSGKIHEGRITKPDQYVTETAKAECHLPLVAGGSLLVAITGEGKTLGNAALVEFDTCVSQHLAYVQFQRSDVLPAFLLYFLQRQYAHLRQMSVGAGSTKKALTCGLLKRYGVPMAPKDEQKVIASALDAVVAKLKAHERVADSLRTLFRTLLHQLMTAQIRVQDLDLSALEEAEREPMEAA